MDAYVTLGTNKNNESHIWVTTVDPRGEATFWESLTGQVSGPNKKHNYRTVGSLFNHESFYANAQPSDGIDTCRFKLQDPACWKELSREGISSIR